MMQGDASALHKGGWSFKLDESERVRAIAGATVLENQLLGLPTRIIGGDGGAGLTSEEGPAGTEYLNDARHALQWRNRQSGIPRSVVEARLQRDEAVFNILHPEDLMVNPLSTVSSGAGCIAAGTGQEGLDSESIRSVDPAQAVNSFTYSQRKKLKSQERAQPEGKNLKPEPLDPGFCLYTHLTLPTILLV